MSVIFLGVAVCGCGNRAPPPQEDARAAAYRLIDQGQHEAVIVLMERHLVTHGDDSEARLLLASAYLGLAGIDLFALFDVFRDVIFDRSLWDRIGNIPIMSTRADDYEVPAPVAEDQSDTPIQVWVLRIDQFLTRFRSYFAFLSRFPHVEKYKWPLFEAALDQLDRTRPDRDIRLYRVFTRLLYLHSVMDQEVISNQELGSLQWACTIDIRGLGDTLLWMTEHLEKAGDDFKIIFGAKAPFVEQMESVLLPVQKLVHGVRHYAPPGYRTGLSLIQNRVRRALRCESLGV